MKIFETLRNISPVGFIRKNVTSVWSNSFTQKQSKKKNGVPNKAKKSHNPAVKFLHILFFPLRNPYLRALVLLVVFAGIAGFVYILRDIPSPRRLTSKENYSVSTQIFDRNGVQLYEIFADEHRIPVELEELPPYVSQASIAIEDKHFYSHFGIDIVGVTRAFINNLKGERLEGGSSITQQLIKNGLLTRERTWQRKAKEAVLAIATEAIYTKEEILEMYLNHIPYGGTAVGIEAAADQYFNKHAKDLTLAEAALLAGLPQAPSKYSPFASDATAAKQRQAEVLRRMAEDGYITQLQAEEAKSEPLHYALTVHDIKAPHFVFYVRDLLYEKYGVETVEKGGLRVTTTLDLELQNTVQASLSAEIDRLERYRVSNGAGLVVKPNTGEILAMIGSKNYFDTDAEGQVNVTLAQRQPGSSIKPIMYAIAFQNKVLNPGSLLLDIPTCFNVPGQKAYCPKNYDGSFKGPVTVRTALGNSLNIPAVKGLNILGLNNFISLANKMGISSWQDPSRYGLSLTLGGGEVRMIDLAQAFGVLANEGVYVPFTPILKIEDYQGNVLEEVNVEERLEDLEALTVYDEESGQGDLKRVMDRAPAYLASHIMQDNNARAAAFGTRSELVIPGQIVSAKTGTTNDLKDNWTVGFTPEFLVITWVGNNDGTPMNPNLVSGVTGAAPIFNDIMSFILKDREPIWQEKPADVLSAPLCSTGMPPQPNQPCHMMGTDLYWKESRPSESTVRTEDVWINPETGLPPQPGESTDGLVLEKRTFFVDPMTDNYCSDCNRATTEEGDVVYEQYSVTVQSSESEERSESQSNE